MKIAISSGKGGTGKTFISTNIAVTLAGCGERVSYLDCDVEEPNGHLFLKPEIKKEEDIEILSPVGVDEEKCIRCGKCAKACNYNAIAVVKDKVLFFPELCHVCGACKIVCPVDAIIEKKKKIGTIRHGKSGNIDVHYALLETAEGGMSPRLVKKVKEYAGGGIDIYDSSPGTACPVVETVKDADLCVLVTDPTPFGVNDLRLAVNMCREINQEPVVIVNRAEYRNSELKEYLKEANLQIIGEIPDNRKIAEVYSVGDMVVEKLPEYRKLFQNIADEMRKKAKEKRDVGKVIRAEFPTGEITNLETTAFEKKPLELVIISGKGGTGKTSVAACFAALAENKVISDCDVDAADLHLILEPEIKESGAFSGSKLAEIDEVKCTGCGRCMEECRFCAIEKTEDGKYRINQMSCEGCGVCYLVCKDEAVKLSDATNGEWFISKTRFGPMTHARLLPAEENSGRLVTLVRIKAVEESNRINADKAIIDGSPGTGCPVIASLTGADYALIVTEPTVSGVHDMKRVLDVAKHFGIKAGIVVNKYDLNDEITEQIRQFAGKAMVEFIGTIPYDEKITEAQIEKLSVVEYGDSPAAKSIKEIWEKIKGILNP